MTSKSKKLTDEICSEFEHTKTNFVYFLLGFGCNYTQSVLYVEFKATLILFCCVSTKIERWQHIKNQNFENSYNQTNSINRPTTQQRDKTPPTDSQHKLECKQALKRVWTWTKL